MPRRHRKRSACRVGCNATTRLREIHGRGTVGRRIEDSLVVLVLADGEYREIRNTGLIPPYFKNVSSTKQLVPNESGGPPPIGQKQKRPMDGAQIYLIAKLGRTPTHRTETKTSDGWGTDLSHCEAWADPHPSDRNKDVRWMGHRFISLRSLGGPPPIGQKQRRPMDGAQIYLIAKLGRVVGSLSWPLTAHSSR